ncbi:alpha-L-rhamnosidase [Cohnella endophytica]|uniref:Alpha-L-rhamnosidase n=1 Tax=Cohnella endophytica TaxID=2419778 RepID=A0A494XZC1_9BACL|nr:alpha-L-rhamnosidase C-terminal domain-containing protein [Cohnella endophytica]RKP52893.1 alpha-L-rhamnosidase [Cohnella endophytica]
MTNLPMDEILKIPRWIWDKEKAMNLHVTLKTSFYAEKEINHCRLFLAMTGGVTVRLDQQVVGQLAEGGDQLASFIQLDSFPETLSEGEHVIELEIKCSEIMPVSPVSIHLSERLVGCVGYLQGDGFWIPTDESWQSNGEQAALVCVYGDEPYGDLENSPEWFARGGFEDIVTESIVDFEVHAAAGLASKRKNEGLSVEGIHTMEQRPIEITRVVKDIFYHLRKQREWQELRLQTASWELSNSPSLIVDLNKEYNARFHCKNNSDHPVQVIWHGAESLWELEHYEGCITEAFTLPARADFVTLPQGNRYYKIHLLGEINLPFSLEFQFEALQVALNQKGHIQSNLPMIDQIFEVSVHTNRICHQIGLWDGVKRDRLNWAYDFYLAGKADYVLWDDLSVLKRSITEIGKGTPYGYWMNSIASYTLWWINNLWEYYFYTGDRQFVIDNKADLQKHISWIEANIDEESGGLIKNLTNLIEWIPISDEEMQISMDALFKLTSMNIEKLMKWIPELEIEVDWKFPLINEAQFLQAETLITPLLGILSGYVSSGNARAFLRQREINDPVTPLSAYWFAECCSQFGLHEKAWSTIELVWGTMLKEGASTFWEGITLAKGSDYHRALTTYTAYSSYRMSLCHSWSSTPVQWISKYLIGVEPLEPGYSKARFLPNSVGGMSRCQGTVNTPYGVIQVSWHMNEQGSILSDITAPPEVELLQAIPTKG